MATFEVELEATAWLRTVIEVEAESPEAAKRKVFGTRDIESLFEGEKFYLTGDVEILSIEEVL